MENVLSELRRSLRDGSYAPLPVRERKIPKRGSGKVRSLGIPALRDRIVQMAARADLRGGLLFELVWIQARTQGAGRDRGSAALHQPTRLL